MEREKKFFCFDLGTNRDGQQQNCLQLSIELVGKSNSIPKAHQVAQGKERVFEGSS
jgi:hypothetical protein